MKTKQNLKLKFWARILVNSPLGRVNSPVNILAEFDPPPGGVEKIRHFSDLGRNKQNLRKEKCIF